MNDKFVTINSVEALAQIANEATERQARYERNGDRFDYGYTEGLNHAGRILDAATVLAPKPIEPAGDVVERVARAIFNAEKGHGLALDATYDNALHVDQSLRRRMARAALSALPPSDAERKLAAVRELRDATAALCKPPAPADDDPMSQGAWAARWEVVYALNAILDSEATS